MKDYLKDKRVVEAMLLTLFPILLYGIIGPLEIYAGNTNEFIFILKDFFGYFVILSVILWLIASLVLILLPKKISSVLRVIVFTFSLLSYLQNMFFNRQLMNTNGSAMNWENMHGLMVTNLIVWIVIAAICFILPLLIKDKYRKIYSTISGCLCLIQMVAVITLLIQVMPIRYSEQAFSGESQFVVAPNDNIIVLVVDSWYNTQFEETLMENRELENTLKDFTYYNNADSHYNYTFPSLPHMLTGTPYDCSITREAWKENCWHEPLCEKFYETLHSLQYECDLYTPGGSDYMAGDIGKLESLWDNIAEMEPCVRTDLLIRLMEKMTIYKYVPYILKPVFEVQDHVMQETSFWDGNSVVANNGEFYQALLNEGLSIDEELNNKFSVIHIRGLHQPWNIHADASPSETETAQEEVSAGLAVIIIEYIEQLKALGIYDTSTIIIMADHGIDRSMPQPIFLIKLPNTIQERIQITAAPISHDDFLATILEILGQDYTEYGTSIFDWHDGDLRTRELWYPTNRDKEIINGFWIFTYETDRYEIMNQSDENASLVTYPLE